MASQIQQIIHKLLQKYLEYSPKTCVCGMTNMEDLLLHVKKKIKARNKWFQMKLV